MKKTIPFFLSFALTTNLFGQATGILLGNFPVGTSTLGVFNVDTHTLMDFQQTTAGATVIIPLPTNQALGKNITFNNTGTQAVTLSPGGILFPNRSVIYRWTGAWSYSNPGIQVASGSGNNVTITDGSISAINNISYLTSETDPNVSSAAKSINGIDVSNWNTSFGWGDHSVAGYGMVTNVSSSDVTTSTVGTSTTTPVITIVSAPKLQTARNIQGVSFDGTTNINPINGTGFVKSSGTTLSYDNSTYLTGNQSITLYGDITGLGSTGITTTLSNSGVTPGTYTQVTVDIKGRVTSGTIPVRSSAIVSRSLTTSTTNTGFIPSGSLDYNVNYSVYAQTTSALAGTNTADVFLESCESSCSVAGNWYIIARAGIILSGIVSTYGNTHNVNGYIPAGYSVRIRTSATGSNSGSAVFTFQTGQENSY